MSIQVTCPSCAKQYAAPASMAGKQVRCKYCGNIFAIAAPDELGGGYDPAALDVTAPAGPAAMPDPDAVFSQAFQDYVSPTRENAPYKFPTATVLDRGLPSVLVVIATVWLAQQTLGGTGTLPGWVGPVRLLLALVLFAAIVYPISWVAVRAASRKLKFDLPPRPHWRVLGAFALPFTVAWVFWLGSTGADGLIYGLVLGLVLGSAAVWLLLRLEPKEATVTLGYTSAGFVLALGLAVAAVYGINAIAMQVAREVKGPTRLTASPLAPGLTWDVTPSAKPKSLVIDDAPDTEAAKAAKPTPPGGVAPRPAPAAVAQVPTPPPAPVSPTPPPGDTGGSILFNDTPAAPLPAAAPVGRSGEAMVSSPLSPAAVAQTGLTPADPAATKADPFLEGIRQARSPLVAAVAAITPAGGGTLTGFAPALAGTPVALLVEPGKADGNDATEVWSLAPPQRRFDRPEFRVGYDRAYAVSPSGASTVRVVTFPSLSFEVWANDKQVVAKSIPVPADRTGARPVVLGFLTETSFLVHWQNEQNPSDVAMEAWDVKTGQHARPFQLFEHTVSTGNWAVSPDGKYFAVVAKARDNKPQLFLYPTGATGNTARFPIPGLEPQWAASPAAMAFSPDSRRLSALYEHDGAAAVYTWRVTDAKLIGPHLIPAGTLPPACPNPLRGDSQAGPDVPNPGQTTQLCWVGDGAWLVRGDAVVESETGRLLGRLGATGAVGQWVNGTNCVLAYRQEGKLRLAHVQLNPKALPATQPAPVARPAARPAVAPAPGTAAPTRK